MKVELTTDELALVSGYRITKNYGPQNKDRGYASSLPKIVLLKYLITEVVSASEKEVAALTQTVSVVGSESISVEDIDNSVRRLFSTRDSLIRSLDSLRNFYE